jgi:hypothetical protein
MLIDTEGNIAFKGHPANRPNLEEDLDKLAAGERLTGEGTGPAEAEEGETKDPEGFKEMDSVAVNKEADEVHTQIEALVTDEKVKEKATGLPRAFCVIVLQEKYFPKTQKQLI